MKNPLTSMGYKEQLVLLNNVIDILIGKMAENITVTGGTPATTFRLVEFFSGIDNEPE